MALPRQSFVVRSDEDIKDPIHPTALDSQGLTVNTHMAQCEPFTALFLKFLTVLFLTLSDPFAPTPTTAAAETEPPEKTAITSPTAKPRAPTTAVAGEEEDPHPKFPCKPPHYSSYPFCNTSLPIPVRVQSI
ncbi:hypothetical protein ACLOJK_003218 [Asimina triloba]